MMQNLKPCILKSRAPAKLIISGEHAVVYGAPALALAVNRFTTITLSDYKKDICFQFDALNYSAVLPWERLEKTAKRLWRRYEKFLGLQLKIHEVIKDPKELLLYAFFYFAKLLVQSEISNVSVRVGSTIPLGCGLGSSAAALISLLHALNQYTGKKIGKDHYLALSRPVENLQHGHSSGLDLYLATHGGCVLFKKDVVEKRNLPEIALLLVNTGRSINTTGACVSHAAKFFKGSSLRDDFASITLRLDQALSTNNLHEAQENIRINHRLLQQIGVVPLKVQEFVAQVEQRGGAAKICGSGAVEGDNAGMLLVSVADENELEDLLSLYGYEKLNLHGVKEGVQIM
jgi:mevalonate kinase